MEQTRASRRDDGAAGGYVPPAGGGPRPGALGLAMAGLIALGVLPGCLVLGTGPVDQPVGQAPRLAALVASAVATTTAVPTPWPTRPATRTPTPTRTPLPTATAAPTPTATSTPRPVRLPAITDPNALAHGDPGAFGGVETDVYADCVRQALARYAANPPPYSDMITTTMITDFSACGLPPTGTPIRRATTTRTSVPRTLPDAGLHYPEMQPGVPLPRPPAPGTTTSPADPG